MAGDWGGVRRDIDAALSAWSGGLQEDTTVAPTPTEATGLVQVRSCDPDSVNNFAHLLLCVFISLVMISNGYFYGKWQHFLEILK